MQPDAVIDRVRKARSEISERCHHDIGELVDYYIALQEQYRDRLVSTKGVASQPEAHSSRVVGPEAAL